MAPRQQRRTPTPTSASLDQTSEALIRRDVDAIFSDPGTAYFIEQLKIRASKHGIELDDTALSQFYLMSEKWLAHRLVMGLTNQQKEELNSLAKHDDDGIVLRWLDQNVPDHQKIVAEEAQKAFDYAVLALSKLPNYAIPQSSSMEIDAQHIIEQAITAGTIPPDNLTHPEPNTIAELEATVAEATQLHGTLTELRERDVPLTPPEAKLAIAGLHEMAKRNAQTARQLAMHALERHMMTQAEAAELLDVNQRTISRWSRESSEEPKE